jgi:WD40 repeat protein
MKTRSVLLAAVVLGLACALSPIRPASEPPAPVASATLPPTEIPPTRTPLPTPTPIPPPPLITVATAGDLSPSSEFALDEGVRTLAISPDNQVLAAGTESGSIKLYELPSGRHLRTIEAHDDIIFGIAFSPRGDLLASASKDMTAKVWNWREGTLLQSLPWPGEVVSVAFTPDGSGLAVGGVDSYPNATIMVYAVDSWNPLRTLKEFWNIPAMAFSPDGALLAGGGTSRNVGIWKMDDGTRLRTLAHPGQVTSLAISPDGNTIATGLCEASDSRTFQCLRGAAWLWNLANGRVLAKLSGFPDVVEGVAFSPDGSVVIAGSRDGTLRAFATDTRETLLDSDPGSRRTPHTILVLAMAPDGRSFATGDTRAIQLWSAMP